MIAVDIKTPSVTFGGYEQSKLLPNSEVLWYPLKHNRLWGLDLISMKLGDSFLSQSGMALIDSFMPGIVLPSLEYTRFVEHLNSSSGTNQRYEGLECVNGSCKLIGRKCSSIEDPEDLKINF